jgi:hypothetical protein
MAFDKEMAKNGDTPAEPAHRIAAVVGKTQEQICRETQERVDLLEVQEKVRKAAEKAKEEANRENEKKVEKHFVKRAAEREKMTELLLPPPMPYQNLRLPYMLETRVLLSAARLMSRFDSRSRRRSGKLQQLTWHLRHLTAVNTSRQ